LRSGRRGTRGRGLTARWLEAGAAAGLLAIAALSARPVGAQEHEPAGHGAISHDAAAAGHAAVAGHGTAEGEGSAAHEHHQEFNWYYGLLGEKAGEEPSLLWRAPGTPAPFVAQLFNTLLLIGLFVRFGRQPLARALADRRQRILRGIEEASAMQAEAAEQLRVYRSKLDNLDAEIERVRREMREGAESERRRVLEEAAARRTRLEQEARVLVERELAALREDLTRETAIAALDSARTLLQRNVSTDDHRRLCEQYLQSLTPDGAPAEPQRPSESVRAPMPRSEAT
jgi:F-type H+-transporting ATPase subunit b